jgi:hypothetical protein
MRKLTVVTDFRLSQRLTIEVHFLVVVGNTADVSEVRGTSVFKGKVACWWPSFYVQVCMGE